MKPRLYTLLFASCMAISPSFGSDDEFTFKYWKKKADTENDANAQIIVGLSYREANGVEQNTEQAIVYFQKAADKGFDEALDELFITYRRLENFPAANYYANLLLEKGKVPFYEENRG